MEIVNTTSLKYTTTEVKPYSKYFTMLAKVTFVLYIIAIFFGTGTPFREKVTEVEDITTSNVMNQIVFTSLFIFAAISIIPRFKSFVEILYREKFLVLFFLWSLLSIAWSDYSFTSFKRWFQVFTTLIVCMSILLHVDNQKDLIKYFKYILAVYLIISIVSVFTIPAARSHYGAWKGLATSKNHLGQAALLNIIIWSLIFYYDNLKGKILSILMIIISLVLLVGANSSTATTTFLLIAFLATMFYLDKYMRPIKVGRLFSLLSIFTVVSASLAIIFFAQDILVRFLHSMGEDLTFTGRTDLWEDILREANKHIWIGAGFQAFWIVDNPHLLALYDVYIWLPNQAHNGYIDILNEVGIIGLGIFIMVIINYFINLPGLRRPTIFKWFVIVALVVNIQESTLHRPQVLTGVFFIFSYLALFTQKYKEDKYEIIEDEEVEETENKLKEV